MTLAAWFCAWAVESLAVAVVRNARRMKKYFSIIVKKNGKFSASRTAKERDKELKSCAGGDPGIVSTIGDKFGGVRGL